jgi:hypothetical protein
MAIQNWEADEVPLKDSQVEESRKSELNFQSYFFHVDSLTNGFPVREMISSLRNLISEEQSVSKDFGQD